MIQPELYVDRGTVAVAFYRQASARTSSPQLAAVSKALDRASFAIVASGLQQCLASGDGPRRH
jgi:hypothetical protein